MNDLIKIDLNEKYEQVVSARDLHKELGILKDFTSWFKQQAERLNLKEDRDFTPFWGESTGGRPSMDFMVLLEIAKHICMASGGEKAWKIRDHFIQVERSWNSPEKVMARAIQISNKLLEESKKENSRLKEAVQEKENLIELQAPKVLFADAVTASKSSVLVGELAKILKQNGVEIGQNRLFGWLREEGYLCKVGENYNLPTQYSMKLGLFEIKKTTINNPDGSSRVTRTPKVTGKGNIYFVNKFLTKEQDGAKYVQYSTDGRF